MMPLFASVGAKTNELSPPAAEVELNPTIQNKTSSQNNCIDLKNIRVARVRARLQSNQ
jgi:hypothetical protein